MAIKSKNIPPKGWQPMVGLGEELAEKATLMRDEKGISQSELVRRAMLVLWKEYDAENKVLQNAGLR